MTEDFRSVVIVMPHALGSVDSGDRRRTFALADHLSQCGLEVVVVAPNFSGQPPPRQQERRFREITYSARREGSLSTLVWRVVLAFQRRIDPFAIHSGRYARMRLLDVLAEVDADVVDFQHSFMWRPLSGRPSVCTMHNIESSSSGRTFSRWQRLQTLRREKKLLLSGCQVIVFSEADAQRARSLVSKAPINVIPLGVDSLTRAPVPIADSVTRLAFVGSMDYQPNAAAAKWLIENWASISKACGARHLRLIGRGALSEWRQDGIEVLSDVPDVGAALIDVDAMLVPLAGGGGVRVKILEALSSGLPVLSTAIGAEGINAIDGQHILISRDLTDFASRAAALTSLETRRRLASEGYLLWRDTYSAAAMAQNVAGVYRNAFDTAPASPGWEI